jgi:DNA (cytosine-5)-methyltransferase 1
MNTQLKKIDINLLFPPPESKPIPVNEIIDCEGTRSQRINTWMSGDVPAATICKMSAGYTVIKNKAERKLSIEEAKLICSFPNRFNFLGKYDEQWARIGNSVPPLLMRSIAKQIKSIMLGESKQSMNNLKKIDYLPFLEKCWQEHLALKPDNAPTVISTFAGCGGSSLGYSMAGFRELLAIEWDDNAVETFKLNFPDAPVYHGDIAKISVEHVLEMTGLKPGELDIFDGSPPCQGFSTAGKRQLDDPRNSLFREYVRLLRGLKPKVFVMENVSGMVKGIMKFVFVEILKELKASGYRVSAKLLNAMYFNVPQARQRMIFIGVRDDLDIDPSHPEAESKPISAFYAIENANTENSGNPKELLVERMKKVKPGSNIGKEEKSGSLFYYVRCPIDKPAMTLQKSVTHGGISMFHPIENRNMSTGELKRITSFHDEFKFNGEYKDIVNRLGNSVPPLFMRSIARHIKSNILAGNSE